MSKQKTLKEQRSFHFPKKAKPLPYGNYRCEVCTDKNIPSNRKPMYAQLALPLKSSKGELEMVLCEEHYLAALALSEWYDVEDENQLIEAARTPPDEFSGPEPRFCH